MKPGSFQDYVYEGMACYCGPSLPSCIVIVTASGMTMSITIPSSAVCYNGKQGGEDYDNYDYDKSCYNVFFDSGKCVKFFLYNIIIQ